MRNYRQLSTFTLVLLFLSGAIKPFNFFIVEALAACTPQRELPSDPMAEETLELLDGDVVLCNDEDTAGIDSPTINDVTVRIQSMDGGIAVEGAISVTDKPGIRLGDDATIVVEGPDRSVMVQGNDVPGIEVGSMAQVTVNGVVSTMGDFSSAIVTGENATVRIDGGDGRRQVVENETEDSTDSEVVIVSDSGIVSTSGAQAAAVSVGTGSMVRAVGRAQISTTGTDSDAVVLNGTGSRLLVEEAATVTTEGRRSNAVQLNGMNSRLSVEGTVSSNAGSTAAVMGTGENVVLNVREGGVITALSSGSNAIELTGTGARITIDAGGEVKVASGNSVAIIAGRDAVVIVEGTVAAAGAGSQGIVIGDGASLRVESTGRIETSLSATQAVLVDATASSATINVASGGTLDASGGQAIVAAGSTDTSVRIDGSVTGGGNAPVLALGSGNDDVTVNGSVRSTSDAIAIDLGSGDDILNDNSSQTISGAGTSASGGAGNDTLNLNNGKINDSADYQQFETTNVGTNVNPGDPLNGTGSTLNVTDDQSGNQINVVADSTLNVQNGGAVDLRADGTANPSGRPGNIITFESGATANVQAESVTGTQPTQNFSSTTFADGTVVNTGSGFIRGVTTNNDTTGMGQIALSSDFTNSAQTSNGMSIGNVLNALADSSDRSVVQQTALNTLVETAADTNAGEAILSNISGEVNAQAAASGVNAAMQFNNFLLPSSNRVDSRGATIATNPDRAERVFEQPAVGNGVWVSGLGSLLSVDRNDDSTAFDANTYGVAVGYDRAAELGTFGTAVFGVGAGYSSTDVDGISDSATVNAFSVGTYLEGAQGPFSGHVAASYSSQDISSDGSTGGSGNLFAISSEAFYNLQPGSGFAVGPIGRLGAALGSYEGFSTESDAFGIDYEGTDVSQVTGAFGIRIGGQNPINVGFMALNLDLLYESSLGDNTVQFDGQMGERDVSIAVPTANKNGFYIGAEAALAISDNSSVGFRYQGSLGSNIQSHTGEIKFSLLF